MLDFNAKYKEYLQFFEKSLNNKLNTLDKTAPKVIKDAMSYSVEGGGKRVRPILCYAACEMLGGDITAVEELALAIEFIHSYSLVHDDLPSMDNDDYRRGKFSTHKQFGEAIGVLAGDALLNYAFETLFSKKDASDNYFSAAGIIARYSGYSGMIGGQVYDLLNEKNAAFSEEELYKIYLNKTAKLITAPLLAASCLQNKKYFDELSEYGYNLGILFQITDDIMDAFGTLEEIGKTPHKDDAENKLTSIKVFGAEGAKDKAKEHYLKAKNIIQKIDTTGFLTEFTDKMYLRKA
ncbi:MAG: polyprenyl synthetase family protein [Clostridia bacterium]|nr:polyprenyl synthetase family protein [Clostridia bacterium]